MESAAVHQCSAIFVTRQGDWTAPDLRGPIFVSKLVLEGDAGEIVTASPSRLKCEMYLLMNRDRKRAKAAGNPRERYARLLALHAAGEQDLLARGPDDAHGGCRQLANGSAAG